MVKLILIICSLVILPAGYSFGFGEEILAATGQYTFFIKPKCEPNVTYYQKMVPCVLEENCPLPRPVMDRYPVPIPDLRKEGVVRNEVPVGCSPGPSDCIECFPKPKRSTGFNDAILPRPIPAEIVTVLPAPNTIRRPVMMPQWFAVYEEKKVPRKVKAPIPETAMIPMGF